MFKESIQDLSKKVFYHGSELKVEEFKIQPPSPEHPIYITSDKKYAESYTGTDGGVYAIVMSNKANIFDPDNSFVLIRLNNIEKIIPRPIPYEKAEKAVEVLYQRMKSGETIELDKSDYDRYEAVLRKFVAELDTF